MSYLFSVATAFNQDIGGWDVSAVTNMGLMFAHANAFNQDIGGWNVSAVTNMSTMFYYAIAFNQDIGGWDVSAVTTMGSMFKGIALSTPNYDTLLTGWSLRSVQHNVNFHGGNSIYSYEAVSARKTLTDSFGWTITDDGVDEK